MVEIYAVDASSLLRIENLPEDEPEQVWGIATDLVAAGRLKTSEFVFEEVQRNSIATYDRLRPFRSQVLVPITPELHAAAGRLSFEYRSMSHPLRPRDAGDPWVIAIAQLHDCKVICEELAIKRFRMSQVCTQERIPCANLEDMLRANGFQRRRR